MRKKIRSFLEWLGLGQMRCAHCLAPYFYGEIQNPETLPGARLCPDCQKILIPYQGPRCTLCALPSPEKICAKCKIDPPVWSGAACHGIYAGPLRDLVLRLKFDGELHIAWLLAEFLLEATKCLPAPELITAVPQYPPHLRRRGYNQAHEIARSLADLGGWRADRSSLKRMRQPKAQETLTAAQRRQNLTGSFQAAESVRGRTIWLIDDVLTTGSTCAAATEALLAAGAKAVYLAFVARTTL